jgi:hypothetical protein
MLTDLSSVDFLHNSLAGKIDSFGKSLLDRAIIQREQQRHISIVPHASWPFTSGARGKTLKKNTMEKLSGNTRQDQA